MGANKILSLAANFQWQLRLRQTSFALFLRDLNVRHFVTNSPEFEIELSRRRASTDPTLETAQAFLFSFIAE
jgi:hypothetical protein